MYLTRTPVYGAFILSINLSINQSINQFRLIFPISMPMPLPLLLFLLDVCISYKDDIRAQEQ